MSKILINYLLVLELAVLVSACSDKSYSNLVKDEPLDKAYLQGYIVGKNRDTIFGQIQDSGENSNSVIYKDVFGKDSLIEPQSVIAYWIGNRCFESLQLTKGYGRRKFEINTFGERVVVGPLTLYKTQLRTDPVLPPTEAFIVKKAGSTDLFPAGSIYNLIPLIQDDEELAKQIASHNFEDTEESKLEIVRKYNEYYLSRMAK